MSAPTQASLCPPPAAWTARSGFQPTSAIAKARRRASRPASRAAARAAAAASALYDHAATASRVACDDRERLRGGRERGPVDGRRAEPGAPHVVDRRVVRERPPADRSTDCRRCALRSSRTTSTSRHRWRGGAARPAARAGSRRRARSRRGCRGACAGARRAQGDMRRRPRSGATRKSGAVPETLPPCRGTSGESGRQARAQAEATSASTATPAAMARLTGASAASWRLSGLSLLVAAVRSSLASCRSACSRLWSAWPARRSRGHSSARAGRDGRSGRPGRPSGR